MLYFGKSFQGHWDDRVAGLVELELPVEGASILDIGCNMGILGYELCKLSPSFYHGVERMRVHAFVARMIFQGVRVEHKIDRINVGRKKVREKVLRDSYDIVLYLAVHQHIKKQIGEAAANEIFVDLLKRSRRCLVFRGPDYADVTALAEESGFARGDVVSSSRINPVCIFRPARDRASR